VLQRAKQGDAEAISLMFGQFIGPEERILAAEYLGTRGIFGFGTHSFGCVTDRRVADIELGLFGRVLYQDGYLEHVNSSAFFQPSLLLLYASVFAIGAGGLLTAFNAGLGAGVAALTIAVTLLLILIVARVYHRFVKSGVLFWVREGVPVYLFANRKRLPQAARVWRICAQARDERIAGVHRGSTRLQGLEGDAGTGPSLVRNGRADVLIAAGIVGLLVATAFGALSPWSGAGDATPSEAFADSLGSAPATAPVVLDTAPNASSEAESHGSRGMQLANEARWEEAAAEFRQASALDPANALYFNELGVALAALDRNEEAKEALREAIRLDPSNDQYRANLDSVSVRP
jgi:tetratricopeptide (TPR) repeat protein